MSAFELPKTVNTNVNDPRIARLDAAWLGHRADQTPPRWQEYLPDSQETGNSSQVFFLLQRDIEYRVRFKLPALLNERYLEHPRLLQADVRLSDEQQVQLIRWEYQQRWQYGERARRQEYLAAFPKHAAALHDLKPSSTCPRCRRPFFLEETFETLSCPVCEGDSWREGTVEENEPTDKERLDLDLRGYELAERLGGGGMGDVYRARDPGLGRDLAVKIMKADLQGLAYSEQRFQREARVTGSLQHPGIVPVYNLGRLPDGRLHYTMRLVRGQTFAEILKGEAGKSECWADQLSIFGKVCEATAYAHSKGVIHRDLKPSNVMVGRFGEVQVMDWGLAKLMTVEDESDEEKSSTDPGGTRILAEKEETPTDLTRTGREMGTPAYMPPEQALGEWDTVDERADVFALGAILCEILTGRPPYGEDVRDALRKARRGDCTEALARLESCGADVALKSLCRDCLTPQRESRPRNADEVARRIALYQTEVQERLRRAELECVAAEARAQEEKARAKAERRARQTLRALLIASVAVLCLALGGGWWIFQEREARAKETLARMEGLARTQEAAHHYMLAEIFYGKGQLQKAIPEYQKSIELQPQNVEYWFMLAAVLYELKRWDEAISAFDMVIRLKPDYAVAYNELGDAWYKKGHIDKAIAAYRECIRLEPEFALARGNIAFCLSQKSQWEEAINEYRGAIQWKPDSAEYHCSLGDCLRKVGRLNEALAEYREALRRDANYAPAHNGTGNVFFDKNQKDEARTEFEKAIELSPQEPIYRNNLGLVLLGQGQFNEAIAPLEQALKQRETNLGLDHLDTLSFRNDLAVAYCSAGRPEEAIRLHEQTLQQRQAKLGPKHPDTLSSMASLGVAYREAGRLTEARGLLEKAFQAASKQPGGLPPLLAFIPSALAATYERAEQFDRAEPIYRETLAQARRQFGSNDLRTANALIQLSSNLLMQKRFIEAEPLLREELQVREDKQPDDWIIFLTRSLLGEALLGQKKYTEAEPLLLQGYKGMKERLAKIPISIREVRLNQAAVRLVQLYEATDQKTKAADWRKNLQEIKVKPKKPTS